MDFCCFTAGILTCFCILYCKQNEVIYFYSCSIKKELEISSKSDGTVVRLLKCMVFPYHLTFLWFNCKSIYKISTSHNMKFTNNFDPESSNKERKKPAKKIVSEGKKNNLVHSDDGIITGLDKDVCDCLIEECPGCHFPCLKCRSAKCGCECRVGRKWVIETIENEGESTVIKNTHLPSGCCVLHS